MSEDPKRKFIPDNFNDDGYALLMAAARLTLRLALNDPDSKIDHPNSFFSLYERIQTLLAAYVNSKDGKVDADQPEQASGIICNRSRHDHRPVALAASGRCRTPCHDTGQRSVEARDSTQKFQQLVTIANRMAAEFNTDRAIHAYSHHLHCIMCCNGLDTILVLCAYSAHRGGGLS